MIDLHSHILPGVDDGARTLEESVALARLASVEGIDVVAATPHVRDDYRTTAHEMERLVAEVRAALADGGVPLDVLPGAEIALDQLASLGEDELRRFGLGGNPKYVLLEFPYYGWPLELGARVWELRARGITPVLAHPERNAEVQAAPERLRPLVEQGALVQLTAASLNGRLGGRARAAAFELLGRNLAHLLASDLHASNVRGIGLARAARAVGDEKLARWLTTDVPAAIVAGQPVPERPNGQRARPSRFRRLWAPGA
jgi:protein-tyrosine phosphatase